MDEAVPALASALVAVVAVTASSPAVAGTTVTGELRTWHRVTITFAGPATAESAQPNPFTDYRLLVAFTAPDGRRLPVRGFYAADGDAADSGAGSGDRWRVHLAPDQAGTWSWVASFRTGANVAVSDDPDAGRSAGRFDGERGELAIDETDKVPPDLRGRGQLRYAGAAHLRFAGTGARWLKYGADSPENFLAYDGFDNTPARGNKGVEHAYGPHAGDWAPGDPTWARRDGVPGSYGHAIIGALNYLASVGANSISMLLYSANGDDDRVFPYTSHDEKLRFDCSKLDQWEIVMSHATARGLHLHFKLSETENDQDHDGGALGLQRRLYYGEMVARFGHHLAVTWNISEEVSLSEGQVRDALAYFVDHDPYGSHRVFHTFPDQKRRYLAFLGGPELTGPSLQIGSAATCCHVFDETLEWVENAREAGFPWVVANDEQGPAGRGVSIGAAGRKHTLWANLMAGGAGVEYYCGNQGFECDQGLEDLSYYADLWTWSGYAVHDFFEGEGVPFWAMANRDDLIGAPGGRCLYGLDEGAAPVYVVYLPEGGTSDLELLGPGAAAVGWFDPRNGGPLQAGTVPSVTGPGLAGLGDPPSAPASDWAILVRGAGPDVPADVNGDGAVDVADLIAVVFAWGPCRGCPEDVDGDGEVDVQDLVEVILGWSP